MKKLLSLLVLLLPWKMKRFVLTKYFHYDIHPSAHIGLSYIFPAHLIMEENAVIGSLNVAIHLDRMVMGKNSSISRNNWITGFPKGTDSKHFAHQTDRRSELIIGEESAITKHHHIDCTNSIKIGRFVTIAGYYSQLLTHSIDVYEGRQSSKPIVIGDYCFVSTNVMILGGSKLPSMSLLAAGAILAKPLEEEWKIYGGVPAKAIKNIPKDAKYFIREKGFVY